MMKNNNTPLSKEVKRHFLEIVSTYNKYQEMIERKSDMTEVCEVMGGIIEAARELALAEADSWFDKITIKRNMTELNNLSKQFDKLAMEAKLMDNRLIALYEDMGNILSRYYHFGEMTEDEMKRRLTIKENNIMKLNGGSNKKLRKSVNEVVSPSKVLAVYNKLKKGDKIHISFGSAISRDNERTLIVVKGKTIVGKTPVERITLKNVDGKGLYYLYNRNDRVTLATGNLAATIKDIDLVNESITKSVREDGKLQGGADDPCWDGYEMVGMKEKGGKEVPNCVKRNENITEANFGYKTSTSGYIKNHNDEFKQAEKLLKSVNNSETRFYDELEKIYSKLKEPKYMIWLSSALRGYQVDMYKDPKIKNRAEAEEALFLLAGGATNESMIAEWNATTTINQLGGNKFISMTGAKNFVNNKAKRQLIFSIGKNSNDITHVRVTLTGDDLYDVEFIKIRGGNVKVISREDGVFSSDLRKIFKRNTGLDTYL